MGKATHSTIEYEMGMTERQWERGKGWTWKLFHTQHFANNIYVNFKFIIIFKGSWYSSGGKIFFSLNEFPFAASPASDDSMSIRIFFKKNEEMNEKTGKTCNLFPRFLLTVTDEMNVWPLMCKKVQNAMKTM